MKKEVLLATMIFMSVCVVAQNFQEVLYLKNGSIIRCVVLEQTPNESVKIQTADGSIFVYKIDEVEKITKEQKELTKEAPTVREKQKYPNRGYRCFLSVGFLEGSDVEGIATSIIHGTQIMPKLFVGGGIGIQRLDFLDLTKKYNPQNSHYIYIPIFTNVHCDLTQTKIAPFLDMRLGVQFGDWFDFYFSPSVGCRFGHFDMSVGYESKRYAYISYHYNSYKDTYTSKEEEGRYGMVAIRFAFDIGAR